VEADLLNASGQTKHNEANSSFLQFCERAHKVQRKQSNPVHRQLYVCLYKRDNQWAYHLKVLLFFNPALVPWKKLR